MNLNDLTNVNDIASKISDSSLRLYRIIFIALGTGVILFAVVCLVLYNINSSKPHLNNTNGDSFIILLYIMIGICAIQYSLIFLYPQLLYKKLFEQNKILLTDKDKKLDIERAIGLIRSFKIVIIALLEGCAFFGLVVVLLAVMGFNIYSQPLYWIGYLPAIILVLYIIKNLPTKESLAEEIYEKIVLKLKD